MILFCRSIALFPVFYEFRIYIHHFRIIPVPSLQYFRFLSSACDKLREDCLIFSHISDALT